MHIRNTEGALVISMSKERLDDLRKFVEQLRLGGEDKETRECLLEHDDEDIFPFVSEANEHVLVILGSLQLHVVLPKVGAFARARDAAMKHLSEAAS